LNLELLESLRSSRLEEHGSSRGNSKRSRLHVGSRIMWERERGEKERDSAGIQDFSDRLLISDVKFPNHDLGLLVRTYVFGDTVSCLKLRAL
jgi:hypothetical protein